MLIFNTEKIHSTQLYALLMSSLRAINPNFPFLLFLRLWSVSKMTSILPEINLSDIKTLCDFETNLDKIFLRRLQWFWKLFYIGVAKVYGSKVFDFFWRFYLWNEWDVSVVERFGQWIRIERERERGSNHILTNKESAGPTYVETCAVWGSNWITCESWHVGNQYQTANQSIK